MAFAVLCKCVFLNVKLIFLYIFKYVLTSCLYQFTFYIIYYICIINNNKYSNNSNNNIYMYIYIYYIYIHFSLCTIFNIPFSSFKYQIQKKKKICKLSFVFLFIYFKMQDFLTDISSLIVFYFAKQTNRLFSCFLEVS